MYGINEIFVSLQGEGIRAGTLNFFVRFSGCNLKCSEEPGPLSPGGFNCDTEFTSGRKMTGPEIVNYCHNLNPKCKNVIFTGGEPLLQLDEGLLHLFKADGFYTAVETNGTIDPKKFRTYDPITKVGSSLLDWITLSPKVAEHCIKVKECDEIKYVRHHGQGVPVTAVKAEHYLISPAFPLTRDTLEWCIGLVKENPKWRLSVQQHKGWAVR